MNIDAESIRSPGLAPPGRALRQMRRRAIVASVVGTSIEWYDFILYSIASGLIFPALYFSRDDPFLATLNAYAVFAVGFVARPVGALIFGHYGDRLGRKGTLIATLMLMGIGTCAVAFIPTYAAIGIWGAVCLSVLRFVQGVGVGGEWAGSVLVAMEWSAPGTRGFSASWPQIGVPLGLISANLAFAAVSIATGDAFLVWGWRIPFLFSAVLVGVGLYIRRTVDETPVFRALEAEHRIERRPVVQAIRKNYRQIFLVAFMRMSEMSVFQIMTVFVFTFGTMVLHLDRNFILAAVMAAAAVQCLCIPLFGGLSDRIGRKRLFSAGAIIAGLFTFGYFALIGTGRPVVVFAAIALSLVPHAMMYGPEAALIAENFSGERRYSGSSIGYQLASLIGGGPTPVITAMLFMHDHSGYGVAGYVLLCSLVSVVAVSFLEERGHPDVPEGIQP